MQTEKLISQFLTNIGEDPQRAGLRKTPVRVTEMWAEITRGYQIDVDKFLAESICAEHYNQMILVKDIDFYSMCEHHLMPFFGKVHIAYIPRAKIVGLSKLPRIVEAYARRLQIQERLTDQIAQLLQKQLKPHGVAVVIEARHLCMEMRGIKKPGGLITTSAMLGEFHSEDQARNEFLQLISKARE